MKSCFIVDVDDGDIAIADLCPYYGHGHIITRINVPSESRGKGYGRTLLKTILRAADIQKVDLFLEIFPSGPLDYDALESWYRRNGFIRWRGIYRRKAQ